MADAFSDFLKELTADTFLAASGSPSSPIRGTTSTRQPSIPLADLVEGDDYPAVLRGGARPDAQLAAQSGVHLLLNHAGEKAGDTEAARREMYVGAGVPCAACSAAATGPRGRPYRVTHVPDEYDLLDQLGKEAAEQARVSGGDGTFDRIVCTDGTELWFDASPGVKSSL